MKFKKRADSGIQNIACIFTIKSFDSFLSIETLGGEKMTNVSTTLATDIIATLTHDFEYKNGITLPSFAGLMARLYMEKYKCPYETLAKIAIKNHFNATLNPNAHFQKTINRL